MNGYGTLLRLNMRERLAGLSTVGIRRKDGKVNVQRIITVGMIALSLLMLLGMVIFLEVMMFRGMDAIGQPLLLPGLALLLAMVTLLFIGFFHVLSGLYFDRDTVWMGYLPVTSHTVLAAKMTELWLGEALIGMAFLLPAFILYGIGSGADTLYYVRMAAVALAAPMIPLSIITLLSSLLSSLTALTRHKDVLVMVGSLVLVTGILIVEMNTISLVPDDADAAWFLRLLVDREALLTGLLGAFPPVLWAVRGLAGDWGLWALFLLCSLGAMALCQAVLGGGYLRLALKQTEQGGSKRRVKLTEGAWRTRSPLMAIFRREWHEIATVPAYAFNCLAGTIAFPLVMVITMVAGRGSSDLTEVTALVSQLAGTLPVTDLLLLETLIVSFVCFMNPAASTCVSREGKGHGFYRSLPVSPWTFLSAKALTGLVIAVISSVIMAAVMTLFVHSAWWIPLAAVALSLPMAVATTAVGVTLDVYHPQFNWSSENQAVKQNINVMFDMLAGLLMLALPVLVFYLLRSADPLSRFAACVAVVVLEAVGGAMLLRYPAVKRYGTLE